MNYKEVLENQIKKLEEVLENQIKKLEEVQEQVLKGIIEGNENSAYTERTLNTIANTSIKIQSLIVTLMELNK